MNSKENSASAERNTDGTGRFERTEGCGYIIFNGMECRKCHRFKECGGHASQKHWRQEE
jgi:hypothetical protein